MTPVVPRRVFLQHFRSPNPAFIHGSSREPPYPTNHPSNLACEHYSCPPSPLLRVDSSLPRHQPEPYIRRCVANAPLPRHTLHSFSLLFLAFLCFSFFFVHLVSHTLCAPVFSLGYGLRVHRLNIRYTTLCVRVPYLVHLHGQTGHHTWCRVLRINFLRHRAYLDSLNLSRF